MRICIIRPGALGDTLLTLPVIQAIRERYAASQITFVGKAAFFPLLQASGLVTETMDYEDARWSELFSPRGIRHPVLQTLLRDCQLVICWLRDQDGGIEHNLRNATEGRIIVAPGRPQEGTGIHISDYLANIISVTPEKEPRLKLNYPDHMKGYDYKTYFAIHPGSGGARKCWPIENYAEVIRWLWQRDIPVLALAGPADEGRLNALWRLLPPPSPARLHILENAPLLQVAYALQQCRGYLGNDSGITHLAALLGIPTVALFIASDPTIWRPRGSSVQAILLQDIGLSSVSTILSMLQTLCG